MDAHIEGTSMTRLPRLDLWIIDIKKFVCKLLSVVWMKIGGIQLWLVEVI